MSGIFLRTKTNYRGDLEFLGYPPQLWDRDRILLGYSKGATRDRIHGLSSGQQKRNGTSTMLMQ